MSDLMIDGKLLASESRTWLIIFILYNPQMFHLAAFQITYATFGFVYIVVVSSCMQNIFPLPAIRANVRTLAWSCVKGSRCRAQ